MAFVVALNVALRLDQPSVPATYRDTQIELLEVRPIRGQPGSTFTLVAPLGTAELMLDETGARLTDDSIERLRTWSLIGVVVLALASGVGGYVVSGVMLRPVRDITDVAANINASSLGQRINHQGPEDELKALADTFDSMIARLERSFDQQSQFVQDASHELRTPLTAIRTNIEVLEMSDDASVDEYKELLTTIKTQTDRLARLTDDLLLLARNEREEVDLDMIDLQQLAREVARELTPLAERKEVSVAVEGGAPAEAIAVSSLAYRCVLNLTDNAIKYSGSGAKVTLRTRVEGDHAVVEVADNGPGIAEEYQHRIFDRFYRIDKGRSRREGGSGLGLAIVKQLVELQGGTIDLQSREGEGTTFTLRFRLAREGEDGEPLQFAASPTKAAAWR